MQERGLASTTPFVCDVEGLSDMAAYQSHLVQSIPFGIAFSAITLQIVRAHEM